jgi:lipid II:glycine glycyltransferase (peptidoglycan interpeptide bridge formation enzyme)
MAFIQEIKEEDLSVCENASSFLQSSMWGEFKSSFGWTAKAFLINWLQQEKTPLLVLYRRLVPGFLFAYIPWGPQLPDSFPEEDRVNIIAELAVKLKKMLPRNVVVIRFEPPWYNIEQLISNEQKKEFLDVGFKQAAATVQPPDTVIINLEASCEDILALMKSKWRYNVLLAEKKGVQVNIGGVQEIDSFYNLLKETAQRDGIDIHGVNYYKTLFQLCAKQQNNKMLLKLYTASHENELLAAIVVLFRGNEAIYLYGASSNNKRNLMAPYALQWKAMRDAKEMGCKYYDLFGIPPNEDPNHPMAGLYRFKTGFGGQIIHRCGTWDYPYKPILYKLFKIAEVVRKKIRDQKKKR